MNREIYQKQALERLASPEQLDQLMSLTRPQEWAALVGIGIVLAAALAWAVFGTIRTTVEGRGILTRGEGVRAIAAEQAGVVVSISAQIGDESQPDQELMRVAAPQGGQSDGQRISSPGACRVLDIAVTEGDTVERGAPLLMLESLTHPLEAVVFAPAADAFQIEPGMEVQVFLGTDRERTTGSFRGRVKTVRRSPAAHATMMQLLQSEESVASLTRDGPCFEIVVGLESESSRIEIAGINSGTPCRTVVTVGRQSPLQMVFPGLNGRAERREQINSRRQGSVT